MHKPEEYKHIAWWHECTGSYPYYIRNLQTQAAQEGAPLTAIFKGHDGRWHKMDEVTNQQMIERAKRDGML